MGGVLSHREARAFYDRFGAKQDLQSFYEDPAVERLIAHADFANASAVVELGCGTGRHAERLLRAVLPASATYTGFDASETMVALAQNRLGPYSNRARVYLTDGSLKLPMADRSCDRFLSTYVLDLLSEEDIRTVLGEARRVLAPGGRLCLVSLTFGETPVSRLLCRVWMGLHSVRPQLVGGCRPLHLQPFLKASWELIHHEVVCTLGVCSEVLVTSPLEPSMG